VAHLDVPTLGQPGAFIQAKEGLLFDASGNIGADSRTLLQDWMDRYYIAWVEKHTV
jgi:chromate reductase